MLKQVLHSEATVAVSDWGDVR